MSESFLLERHGNIIRFENCSSLICVIKLKPIPPKRKYHWLLVVQPKQFVILEQAIDLDKIAITFEEPQFDKEE